MTAANDYTYWGFLSYSSSDAAVATRFHRALERYRVPRDLVGKPTREGDAVPRNLFPIFRDRDELALSADLGSSVEDALRASRYLIVICSPHAAQSRWVSEEVRYFRFLGREDRILAVIVAGEPNASDQPGRLDEECFPVALRYRTGADGSLTDERTEPMAGDLRKGGDGWTACVVKAVAGMTGLPFDAFLKRQQARQRRQHWQRFFVSLAALAIVVAVSDSRPGRTLRDTASRLWTLGRNPASFAQNIFQRNVGYYAHLTEHFGVPSGAVPLKTDALAARAKIYRVESLGGRVSQAVCVNGTDSALPAESQVGTEDQVFPARAEVRNIKYFENGDFRIESFSGEGRLQTTEHKIEKNGSLTIIYMTVTEPPSNHPAKSQGRHEAITESRSRIPLHKIVYGEDGLPEQRFFLDLTRKPLADAEGCFGKEYSYDNNGLVCSIWNLDQNGLRTPDRRGILYRVLEREMPFGNVTIEKLLDVNNKLVLGPEGYAKVIYSYDDLGNLTDETYKGADDKCAARSGSAKAPPGFAHVVYKYDKRGNLVERNYYDINNNLLKRPDEVETHPDSTTVAHENIGNENQLIESPQIPIPPPPPPPPPLPVEHPISFTSDPEGARLEWVEKRQAMGVMPIRDYILPAGEHTFVAYYKNWEPQRKVLSVGTTRPEDVEFRWPRGEVDFESDPPGAQVFRGEEKLGATPFQLVLQQGHHEMLAKLPGLDDVPIRFDLSDGDKGKVPIHFRYGTVSVETAPTGVEVSIDGHDVGSAPLKFNIRPGPIRLHFRKPGYESADYNGEVPAGKALHIRITMHNEPR